MLSAPLRQLMLAACLLSAPILCFGSSIVLNGTTCESGTCPPVDTLASGASVSSTAFAFTYVAGDGDWFGITGNYAAANPASGDTSISFNVNATYEGNGGINGTASAGTDSFTIADLQDYNLAGSTYYTDYGTLNGIYSESTDSGILGGPTGSSWQAQLSYNGQSLPVLGPFTGPGFASNSAALTGFGSATVLDADYLFTYDFAKGTAAGSGFSSTPEPKGLIPVAAVLALCLGLGAFRRARLAKSVG